MASSSGSGGRSPRKLREVVNSSKINNAKLICILKQRADESLKKSTTLEEENSELKKHRDEILSALHNETRKYAVLEKRFFVLNQNHEELIKIKDEYKTENETLRIENSRLRKENEGLFGSLIQERDSQIKQLRDEVKSLQEKYQAAKTKERIALENASSLEKTRHEQAEKLQKKLQHYTKRQKVCSGKFCSDN
ncbi:Coiled-coil domain containing 89 [Desmophyllum pertusum]|uniref:Coiled-coil domain containing 89 n=1 Tax=Desmophyllum pertusum TaxID=174260 RepID=A0A9W9YYV3_9CNID|nr:Coiled-coil domain containing 89 [Desmophyllum pertusum]